MSLLLFLIQVFVISLSGVMAPGPVTTAAIAMGSRNRWAGSLIGIGHLIIELPLIILLMLGIGHLLRSTHTQIIIGIAGGIFLVFMAVQMLVSLKTVSEQQDNPRKDKPILTGIILSVSNPYFLIWWAAVGLNLVIKAKQLGIWAFVLFAMVHWLCDCLWLQVLSLTSFKGTRIFGSKGRRVLLLICALALLFFGLKFLYDAASNLFG